MHTPLPCSAHLVLQALLALLVPHHVEVVRALEVGLQGALVVQRGLELVVHARAARVEGGWVAR